MIVHILNNSCDLAMLYPIHLLTETTDEVLFEIDARVIDRGICNMRYKKKRKEFEFLIEQPTSFTQYFESKIALELQRHFEE